MRTKLNYLLMLFAALTISTAFTSCNKDDEPENSDSIIGTWVDEDEEYSITFNSNGYGYDETKAGKNNFQYTYVAKDRKLQMSYINSTTVYIYEVARTGNTLMLSRGSSVLMLRKK